MSGPTPGGDVAVRLGDCLDVLPTLAADSVTLCYMDPPFGKQADFEGRAGAFSDKWTWGADCDARTSNLPRLPATAVEACRRLHGAALGAYVLYMAERLVEVERVMMPAGSVWLHCDDTANYWLRVLMDAAFGRANFRNAVAWCYTGPTPPSRRFRRKHDTLLWYAGDGYTWNQQHVPYAPGLSCTGRGIMGAGLTPAEKAERERRGKPLEDWWPLPIDLRRRSVSHGYPTQKPIKLLRRIVAATSDPGDLVLDPFCGSGTALVAAKEGERRYVGIDLSERACELARRRLGEVLL